LDYPIPRLQASLDVCAHIPLTLWVSTFYVVHGNEHIGTHDAIHNTFATIVRNVGFHMGQEQLHVFFSTTFSFSYQRVNIMFTKDGIRTLADVVIVNPMQADLLPQFCTTQKFVTFDAIQAKEKSYCIRHPTD
jgi:hypothetical protein